MINCGADSGGAVEPLSLEVCLFDNRSSAWSCLLGRGVLPLTPVIIADTAHSKIERAVKPSGVSKEQKLGLSGVTREVVLLEPRTGKMMATVPLELEFTPRDKSAPESTASEESRVQVDGELGDSCKFLRKVRGATVTTYRLESGWCHTLQVNGEADSNLIFLTPGESLGHGASSSRCQQQRSEFSLICETCSFEVSLSLMFDLKIAEPKQATTPLTLNTNVSKQSFPFPATTDTMLFSCKTNK